MGLSNSLKQIFRIVSGSEKTPRRLLDVGVFLTPPDLLKRHNPYSDFFLAPKAYFQLFSYHLPPDNFQLPQTQWNNDNSHYLRNYHLLASVINASCVLADLFFRTILSCFFYYLSFIDEETETLGI